MEVQASRETVKVDLENSLWIVVKKELTYGEQRRLRKVYIDLSLEEQGEPGEETGSLRAKLHDVEEANVKLIELAVIEWNLASNGERLPITAEVIDSLKDSIARQILVAINRVQTQTTSKKGKR